MSGKHVNGSEDSRQQKFRRNFTEQGKSLQDRYGITGKHNFAYMGWMPPMTRRAARKIARKLARRKAQRAAA